MASSNIAIQRDVIVLVGEKEIRNPSIKIRVTISAIQKTQKKSQKQSTKQKTLKIVENIVSAIQKK